LGEAVVIGAVRRIWDNFRGGGEASVTVPPMDGALRPNQRLEQAPVVLEAQAPDNLVSSGARVFFSSGVSLLELDVRAGAAREIRRFDHVVSALAVARDGALAVGLDDGRVVLHGGARDGLSIDTLAGARLVCPTALLFDADDQLLIAQGSASRPPREWKHDAMTRGDSGSVWRVDLSSRAAVCLADLLSWPYGLAPTGDGELAVAESWRHRLVVVPQRGGAIKPVLEDLPGYPARLATAAAGGYWLTVFATRNQLIEFVQREPEFLRRMMRDVDPDHWVAPSLKPPNTFLEPLQGGAQKHLGMVKPWAPTRSYGLVIRLDRSFRPTDSFHSRADGRRHGVASCVERLGQLLVASKGGDAIVALGEATTTPSADAGV
jgi:hypothetical protein